MHETSDPSQALARRWFQKAENDLLDVRNNLQAEQYASDTVCFHCQQAEKFYPIEYAWRKGEHPRRGYFNPDFFIKKGNHVLVIENKGKYKYAAAL